VESCRVYYKGEGGGFPQVRAVVSLVCSCCPWLVLAPRVLQICTNHFVWVVCRPVWMSEACQLFLVPSRSSNTPLYPSKCCELGSVLQLLLLPLFSYLGSHLSPLRSWECIKRHHQEFVWAHTLVQTLSRSDSAVGSYGRSKFRESSRDSFGTPFWESQQNVPFGCSLGGELQRILYGGRWWLPLSPGRGESCMSKCPWQVPTPKGVPNAKLTFCGWFLDADSHELN